MPDADRSHILTVCVEEFFHGGALSRVVLSKHWDRFESRVDRHVDEVLRMLDRFRARATFFVLGILAERNPELVARIAAAGHEIASRGFWPHGVGAMMEEEFGEDLDRTKSALEAACGSRVLGYRSARWLRVDELWILEVLARRGYRYDSSVNPIGRRFGRHPRFLAVREHELPGSGRRLWEVPISSINCLGFRAAISGGNWTRQLPHWLLAAAVARWVRRWPDPIVYYFNTWELDDGQPRITGASRLARMRAYRNIQRMRWSLEYYLERYRFESIARWLQLPSEPVVRGPVRAPAREFAPDASAGAGPPAGIAVAVVVPIYNEAENVGYLMRTLDALQQRLRDRYRFKFVLVDDGSSDASWQRLCEAANGRADVELLRHERNRGVAAAIQTGIAAAPTEIVCSIDCDCSYDPQELGQMLPLIEGADVVTASPYHPEGQVLNVPGWRLFLSRWLSRLYRAAVRADLSTWTSCFRVYRRSRVVDVTVENEGFLGIAEQIIRLMRRGRIVREYPTLLEARLLGASKMKTLRTIRGHLGLLWQVLCGRVR
jgi:polysaccharide deacetylase family protein (PEP-CTERM system associated)